MNGQIVPVTTPPQQDCSFLDTIKNAINCFIHSSDELDCTVRENALRVLGLSEDEANDKEKLDKRYNDLCLALRTRIENVEKSPPLVKKLSSLYKETHISYQTLCRGK